MAASAPILQQQEEMKEVSLTGTLSGQGQYSDPCKLAPDPTECVSASLLLRSLRQNGRDFVVEHQSLGMKYEDVFLSLVLFVTYACSWLDN